MTSRGREGERPSFKTNTGYMLHYRHLSPETMPRLEAAAKVGLASTRPEIPTQRVEVGPDEWRDQPNPHDQKYQETLEQWELAVQQESGKRFLTLCEEYALIYEVDTEEVAQLRMVQALIGDPLDDLSDKQVFLWKIALPTFDDQMLLYAKLFGGLTEEAIQAQKGTFLSKLQQNTAAPSA